MMKQSTKAILRKVSGQSALAALQRSFLPFWYRAHRGSRASSLRWLALFSAIFSLCATLWILHSPGKKAQNVRETLGFERVYHPHEIAWERCGFCSLQDPRLGSEPPPGVYLAEPEGKPDAEQSFHCMLAARDGDWSESLSCHNIGYPYESAIREASLYLLDYSQVVGKLYQEGLTSEVFAKRRQMVLDQEFQLKIQPYHSPLGTGDALRVWATVSGFLVLLLIGVWAPLALCFCLGRELYDDTWSLLRATGQSSALLLAALCVEALVPVLYAGLPLMVVLAVQGMITSPLMLLHFAFGLAALLASSLAIASLLNALLGRRYQPGIVAALTAVGSLGYFVLLQVSSSLGQGKQAERGLLELLGWPGLRTWEALQGLSAAPEPSLAMELSLASSRGGALAVWPLYILIAALLGVGTGRYLQSEGTKAASARGWWLGFFALGLLAVVIAELSPLVDSYVPSPRPLYYSYLLYSGGVFAAALSFLRIPLREGELLRCDHRMVFRNALWDVLRAWGAMLVPSALVAAVAGMAGHEISLHAESSALLLAILLWFAVNGVIFAMWRHSVALQKQSKAMRLVLSGFWLTAMVLQYLVGVLIVSEDFSDLSGSGFDDLFKFVVPPTLISGLVGLVLALRTLRALERQGGE